ncbi:MAG: hypothetical protein R3C31_14115 [Hyphomonadaceae bacterium]
MLTARSIASILNGLHTGRHRGLGWVVAGGGPAFVSGTWTTVNAILHPGDFNVDFTRAMIVFLLFSVPVGLVATIGTACCYVIGRGWWGWLKAPLSTLIVASMGAYLWLWFAGSHNAGFPEFRADLFPTKLALYFAIYLPFSSLFWLLQGNTKDSAGAPANPTKPPS